MIEAINSFWGLVVIVSVIVTVFFRFAWRVQSVFTTVKNQETILSRVEALERRADAIDSGLQALRIADASAEKERQRLERENNEQWTEIKALERRTFEMLNGR